MSRHGSRGFQVLSIIGGNGVTFQEVNKCSCSLASLQPLWNPPVAGQTNGKSGAGAVRFYAYRLYEDSRTLEHGLDTRSGSQSGGDAEVRFASDGSNHVNSSINVAFGGRHFKGDLTKTNWQVVLALSAPARSGVQGCALHLSQQRTIKCRVGVVTYLMRECPKSGSRHLQKQLPDSRFYHIPAHPGFLSGLLKKGLNFQVTTKMVCPKKNKSSNSRT